MPTKIQTRKNHARLDPAYHFFLVPLLLLLLIWTIVHLVCHPGTEPILLLIIAVAMFLMAFLFRSYALKVQDRVIRLEERLRLAALLPEPLRFRIPELTEAQLIGLRFASDAELPALVQRVFTENLSRSQIKDLIQNWRGDYWRV